MATSNITVTIQPLDTEDIPTFIALELDAFRTHPRIPMLWPRGYTPDLYAYYTATKTATFHNPQSRFFKAVTNAGEMIGGLQMTVSLHPTPSSSPTSTSNKPEEPPSNWPSGGNWPMYTFFRQNSHLLVHETFGNPTHPHIIIDYLIVSPAHQNRHIGTQLLLHACSLADEQNLPIALESTPAGVGMYTRHGFVERKTIKEDMRRFGWEEEYDEEACRRVWMVRPPRHIL